MLVKANYHLDIFCATKKVIYTLYSALVTAKQSVLVTWKAIFITSGCAVVNINTATPHCRIHNYVPRYFKYTCQNRMTILTSCHEYGKTSTHTFTQMFNSNEDEDDDDNNNNNSSCQPISSPRTKDQSRQRTVLIKSWTKATENALPLENDLKWSV